MEIRCGDIDPGIHAYMMQAMHLSVQELEQVLNHKNATTGSKRTHFLYLNGPPEVAAFGFVRERLPVLFEGMRRRETQKGLPERLPRTKEDQTLQNL